MKSDSEGAFRGTARGRLLILSQYFPPEMGAPQARLYELGELLHDRGWDLEVLTALPNYPHGRVFAGYARPFVKVERVGRLRTVRVPLVPAQQGFLRRLLSYQSFAVSAVLHGPRYLEPCDLIWVESPPLFIGQAAMALAARWRCGYVFNVSDLWPESAIRMGIIERDSIAARLASALEHLCYARAAGVTGQTEETVAEVRRRAPTTPVEVITNGVDPARFGRQHADAAARALIGPEPGPVFIYAGLLGLAQGLSQLFDVFADLPNDVPGRLVLVGDGPVRDSLERQVRGTSSLRTRVKLLPAQPRDRIPALLACADVALISLGYRLPGAVPSKIYEAMAAGLPILLIAEDEPAERVRRAGAGLTVSPGEHAAAVAAAVRLATDAHLRAALGAAGRAAAERTYNRAAIADRLDRFLQACLRSK